MIKIVRIIARLNVGGPARHCYMLSPRLRARGFETVLAAGDVDRGEAEMKPEEAGVDARDVTLVRVPGLGRRISPRDDVRALASLVALLRRERPLVVHTHTAKAGGLGRIAAAIAGVPAVIHTFHGHVLRGYFGPAGSWAVATAERALALLADRLVTLSPGLERELARDFRVAPPSKFEVVPLGQDLAHLASPPRGRLRAELGVAGDVPLVGFVGRLVPIKAPAVLLDALARARGRAARARLVVAGDGPLADEVRALASRLGVRDRVHLLGWRSDLPSILGDLDLLALSSLNEGTPLAIVEAFAAGVPVVSTAVGGVPDMLTGGEARDSVDLRAEGALVPPSNPEALARALELLLDRPELLAKAREAARARARLWDVERLAGDLASLYRRVLAGKRRGSVALALEKGSLPRRLDPGPEVNWRLESPLAGDAA